LKRAQKKLINDLPLKFGYSRPVKQQLPANVRGLPQGWYFITVCPATEADLKTEVEVNN
jgi:hypothetical protein